MAALALLAAVTPVSAAQDARGTRPASEKPEILVNVRLVPEGGEPLRAVLHDNPTARQFATLLPLTVTLKDYAATEKISDLPRRLTTDGAPDGFEPALGDIAYYAPWGNLAIFHKSFRYSPQLVRLGAISEGIERLAASGAITVTIERVD